jgi:hypothetical protein
MNPVIGLQENAAAIIYQFIRNVSLEGKTTFHRVIWDALIFCRSNDDRRGKCPLTVFVLYMVGIE